MTSPATPPGRYDAPRSLPARSVRIATVVAAVLGLVVAYLLYTRASMRGASGSLVSYATSSPAFVDVRFDVRRPAGRAAVCAVRALARDGTEVGTADVPVPATTSRTLQVSYRLATRTRAATAEVRGCAVRGPRP